MSYTVHSTVPVWGGFKHISFLVLTLNMPCHGAVYISVLLRCSGIGSGIGGTYLNCSWSNIAEQLQYMQDYGQWEMFNLYLWFPWCRNLPDYRLLLAFIDAAAASVTQIIITYLARSSSNLLPYIFTVFLWYTTLLTALQRRYYVIHLGKQQPVQMDGCDTLFQCIALCCHSSSCRVDFFFCICHMPSRCHNNKTLNRKQETWCKVSCVGRLSWLNTN